MFSQLGIITGSAESRKVGLPPVAAYSTLERFGPGQCLILESEIGGWLAMPLAHPVTQSCDSFFAQRDAAGLPVFRPLPMQST